jgi:hypothetical protein
MEEINMKNLHRALILITGMLVAVSFAQADTPSSLRGEHGSSFTATGKVTLFRAQYKGLEIGPPNDHLDAEVLVTLDSEPDKVFGIRLHEDEPSAREMIETLREAFLHNLPVTIQSPLSPGKKHLRITWVQLGK